MSDSTVDKVSPDVPKMDPGPYLATVVSNLDSTYMGILEVKLLRPTGNNDSAGQLFSAKYMSPFYGQTSQEYVTEDPDDYNNTQKSYGFWAVPPDVGSTVIVIFIQGNPKRGFWIGCVPDENKNFMVPGLAATKYVVEGDGSRIPVAEYNSKVSSTVTEPTKIAKPRHPFADILAAQGLLADDVRGITTSSSRRESPSMVFGISTPGPIDKNNGAKRGMVGKTNKQVNAFVSRLGGSSFVMDDGDDKFLRKTPADKGPPDYAAVEQGEADGDVNIPHNELVRIRTRTGHQILFHNSEDLIYISNAKGTTWIELTSNGKIDIYAEDSISIHTKNDMNFLADRDINLEAGRNVNIKAAEIFHAEAGTDYHLIAAADGKITVGGVSNINAAGNHVETAAEIHMNGPTAATAEALSTFANPDEAGGTVDSIMLRVPSHEPWPHHENLDPTSFTTDATDREAGSVIATPNAYGNYTTTTDTFEAVKPTEEPQ